MCRRSTQRSHLNYSKVVFDEFLLFFSSSALPNPYIISLSRISSFHLRFMSLCYLQPDTFYQSKWTLNSCGQRQGRSRGVVGGLLE